MRAFLQRSLLNSCGREKVREGTGTRVWLCAIHVACHLIHIYAGCTFVQARSQNLRKVTASSSYQSSGRQKNNSSRDEIHEKNSRIYTRTDYRTNTQISNELKITPILDKLLEYKRNWIQYANRMPRNKLPRVMKHLAVNKLNKQPRTADEGWSSSLGVGRGANNPSP